MRLTSTTSGKCKIKTNPDNADRVCDALERAELGVTAVNTEEYER